MNITYFVVPIRLSEDFKYCIVLFSRYGSRCLENKTKVKCLSRKEIYHIFFTIYSQSDGCEVFRYHSICCSTCVGPGIRLGGVNNGQSFSRRKIYSKMGCAPCDTWCGISSGVTSHHYGLSRCNNLTHWALVKFRWNYNESS